MFWDVFGKRGFPIRATVSDLGPLLLGRLFGLNATQQGVLALVFKIADDNGLLLLDVKDLRAMLQFAGDNASQFNTEYGHISAASIGAIQRAVLEIDQQGGASFFGEPMLDVDDLIQTDARGRGMVNVLVADELIRSPKVYATFLLWMLSELFERLPEVGDPDKPTLVFFFDEAHLLFTDATPALIEKIEQVVRLIRSKGVGVYFVTQSPADVPDTVLGQLGNRVQHALRAFTPRDQKAVKTAADTLRPNPTLDIGRAITELAVGEALVSTLDAKGSPTVTERAWIVPPASRIGPITDTERAAVREQTKPLYGHYEQSIDRESAYEKLKERTAGAGQAGGAGAGRKDRTGGTAAGPAGERGPWRPRQDPPSPTRCRTSCSARPARAAASTTDWSNLRPRAPRVRSARASGARSSEARWDRSSADHPRAVAVSVSGGIRTPTSCRVFAAHFRDAKQRCPASLQILNKNRGGWLGFTWFRFCA